MASPRTALKKGKQPAQPLAQPQVSLKRCHRSTHEILAKLRQVMTDFFAVDDLLSYDVDTIMFEDEITLRISGDNARMDVRIVSLLQEGGEQ